ncbi:hypothetical protein RhiirC2_834036 [Rhizophagus irregularis]|uniref:Uncharacterized protein n=1 Tax=Rhizophagus irregularis TaxID=588596 RepID=A0A2N1N352_9GLOM|nr:hypothetical protein RhiirC2_834036 [Rhizophagus irregularis]
MDDIPVPVPVSTPVYKKFEENNPDISLCVYEWHNKNECLEFRYVSERRGACTKRVYSEHLPKCKGQKNAPQQPQMPQDLSAPAEIILAMGDLKAYNKATECWICKKSFLELLLEKIQKFEEAKHRLLELEEWEASMGEDYPEKKKTQKVYREALSALNCKVKDHDHISVVNKFTAENLNCIPENIGKYKAIDVGQLQFFDSFQHMEMGLNKLVECLGGKLEKFSLTVRYFSEKVYLIDKIKLLFRKGVFPYDWTNSWEKFDGTNLPRRKDFYLILSQQNISKEDYEYSQKIWQEFEMKNFGEYHDLYLETEILEKVGSEDVPDIQSIAPDAEIGYMLEIDLEVPVHLHDFFADYPLAPERQIVPEKWLSLYNERLVRNKAVGVENICLEKRQAILDISKAMMFNFWYGYIKPRYEDKACLLYTDTDSLIMWIETEDIYKDRARRPNIFDLDYSGDLFLMKDETKGNPIGESVCLKPKMYSVLPAGHDPKTPEDPDSEDPKKKHGIQKAKGVKKCVVKRDLCHDKFLECLRSKKLTRRDMYGLRGYDHQIFLEKVNKIGLNPYDNKRWILLDGVRTLPYGHWRIDLYKRIVASGIPQRSRTKGNES